MIQLRDNEIPRCFCPTCGEFLEAATSIEGQAPDPDDVSVCAYCQAVLIFKADMTLRLATAEELEELETNLAFRGMRELVRVALKKMRAKTRAPGN